MSLTDDALSVARTIRHKLTVRKATKLLLQSAPSLSSKKYQVFVYFADSAANIYQLSQWFPVLAEVDKHQPVTILTRSADAALALRSSVDCPFPVLLAARHNDIDPFVLEQDPKVVFYVNHHRSNFAMLWHPSMLHVYIGHGDSDKIGISASNQLKAYDYTFVAGQAAIDRIKRRLINFDADKRLVPVGRPQTDMRPPSPAAFGHPQTVLYAPSWEGDRPFNAYGSARTHGVRMINALLDDGRYRVVFRPHPLSGQRSPEYVAACKEIADLVREAATNDPKAGHKVDDQGVPFESALAAADLVVADVSAVALDAIGAGRPLVITKPSDRRAIVSDESVMSRFELLPAAQAEEVVEWLVAAQSGPAAQVIEQARRYCFGDFEPGQATRQFVEATRLIARRRDSFMADLPS